MKPEIAPALFLCISIAEDPIQRSPHYKKAKIPTKIGQDISNTINDFT